MAPRPGCEICGLISRLFALRQTGILRLHAVEATLLGARDHNPASGSAQAIKNTPPRERQNPFFLLQGVPGLVKPISNMSQETAREPSNDLRIDLVRIDC